MADICFFPFYLLRTAFFFFFLFLFHFSSSHSHVRLVAAVNDRPPSGASQHLSGAVLGFFTGFLPGLVWVFGVFLGGGLVGFSIGESGVYGFVFRFYLVLLQSVFRITAGSTEDFTGFFYWLPSYFFPGNNAVPPVTEALTPCRRTALLYTVRIRVRSLKLI